MDLHRYLRYQGGIELFHVHPPKAGISPQSIFENRIGWAKTYLKKVELVDSPSWGQACTTAECLASAGFRVAQELEIFGL